MKQVKAAVANSDPDNRHKMFSGLISALLSWLELCA